MKRSSIQQVMSKTTPSNPNIQVRKPTDAKAAKSPKKPGIPSPLPDEFSQLCDRVEWQFEKCEALIKAGLDHLGHSLDPEGDCTVTSGQFKGMVRLAGDVARANQDLLQQLIALKRGN